MSKPDRASWENFSDYLISQGLRMTGQRKAVFDALFRQSGHFTADQLLQDAQKMDDTVSRATVYRCLPLLVGSGTVRKIDVGRIINFTPLMNPVPPLRPR